MLMKAWVLHLEFFIDFTSFSEIHELPVVVPSLMTVVHIVSVLHLGPFALLEDKFYYSVWVDSGPIENLIIGDSRNRRV